jgi:hypothetical protein
MTPTKASRGRPKGTGLNDAAQLQAIADLIAADPTLKPTTAIKTLGISDPSVIRRLRDKYHLEAGKLQPGLPVPELAGQRPAVEPLRLVARDASAASRSAALAVTRPAKVTSAVDERARPRPVLVASARPPVPPAAKARLAHSKSSVVSTAPAVAPTVSSPDAPPAWIDNGVAFLALSLEAHFAVLNSVFQWPPAVAVVRSQVAFAELALAMATPFQFQPRRVS